MPFGIKTRHVLDVYTLGDTTQERAGITYYVTPGEAVRELRKLYLPDAVLEFDAAGVRHHIPVRAVARVEERDESDAHGAQVELYEDAAGVLFLRDPEDDKAWPVGYNPAGDDGYDRGGEFGYEAHGLIAGEWTLGGSGDQPRSLDGLTKIATYHHGMYAPVELAWSDSAEVDAFTPAAGAAGRAYIGDRAIKEATEQARLG